MHFVTGLCVRACVLCVCVCVCVRASLQQGQIQVLSSLLGQMRGEGHQRNITSTGMTDQTAAQERHRLGWTLTEKRDEWQEVSASTVR